MDIDGSYPSPPLRFSTSWKQWGWRSPPDVTPTRGTQFRAEVVCAPASPLESSNVNKAAEDKEMLCQSWSDSDNDECIPPPTSTEVFICTAPIYLMIADHEHVQLYRFSMPTCQSKCCKTPTLVSCGEEMSGMLSQPGLAMSKLRHVIYLSR